MFNVDNDALHSWHAVSESVLSVAQSTQALTHRSKVKGLTFSCLMIPTKHTAPEPNNRATPVAATVSMGHTEPDRAVVANVSIKDTPRVSVGRVAI